MHKPRLLIFIVAYQAQSTLALVLARIPASLNQHYEMEVLVIDDASQDQTFDIGQRIAASEQLPFKVTMLFNPVNQGYGGNQKIGYHYAIEYHFDLVVLLHGDGQYAPECLGELLSPFEKQQADAVFGSRMLVPNAALKGGMPLYKYVGNKILTRLENSLLKSNLSEFHSGYRIYTVNALKSIPFELNTNDFHFDTEIIIQLFLAKKTIIELPIPTYYGDEICRVNGMRYAKDVILAVIASRLQSLGILYAPNFDCVHTENQHYQLKLGYTSPHSEALKQTQIGDRVIDLGCAGGYLGEVLKKERNCIVTGVDFFPLNPQVMLDTFIEHDLNQGLPKLDIEQCDKVLLLDVLEHLDNPEAFIQSLQVATQKNTRLQIIVSTGNIGFLIPRLMLLIGQFNYGKRGILDITHKRFFTFSSFKKLFSQNGFEIELVKGIPAPFPLAIKNHTLSRFALWLNTLAIRISKGLFAYQIFLVVKPLPTLSTLLQASQQASELRKSGTLG
jgi:glycosyltransferase involved in cell wall biosynthesis